VDGIIGIASANSYDGVEIRAASGTVELWNLPEFSGAGLGETACKFKDNGLVVVGVGTSINFCKADAAHRKAGLETAKIYFEIANGLDCPYIRLFGGPLPATQGYLDSIHWSREGYEQLCELAGQAGITPLIETHDDFSVAPRVLDILDGVSASNIGVIWDILHSYRFGEPLQTTYDKLKDKIKHVHIKDSAEFSAAGFDLTLVGEGKVPVLDSIDILRRGGYEGFISFEWEKLWHPEIPEPEIAIPHFAEYLKRHGLA
jgi:sugar phosphate isomerase/epimerase